MKYQVKEQDKVVYKGGDAGKAWKRYNRLLRSNKRPVSIEKDGLMIAEARPLKDRIEEEFFKDARENFRFRI